MKSSLYIRCLQFAIISCAISVSISQLFLFLTLVLFLLSKKKYSLQFTSLTIIPLGIFGLYFLSVIAHLLLNQDFTYFLSLKSSELKDFLLFSAFFVVQNLGSEEEIKKIRQAFWILLLVLIISGFVSIFSQIRLSRLIMDMFISSPSWKFAHHYGNLLGVGIHLPIGFMNTHLTFGGILLLFSPFVFFRVIFAFRDRKSILFHLLVFCLFGLVALLNNARSSMLGGIISILIGFIDLLFVQKYFSIRNTIKLVGIPILLIGLVFSILIFNETTAKTIQPLLGQEKHTDSGRTFIWSSTFPMIKSNPLFGVGPGNYGKEVEKARKKLSQEYKELLFFFEVTQRGHAHNDFFHIAAIAGLPAMFCYLLLGATIAYQLLQKKESRDSNLLFYGLLGFFFAGLFQCYFQDDEVVIVFWYLLGFFNFTIQKNKSNFQT